MNPFYEGRLPLALARGGLGGVERRTEVVAVGTGREIRNAVWAHGRRRYDLAGAIATLDDIAQVFAFFEARRGRLQAFRFRDIADCKSCAPSAAPSATDQALGAGDGARTAFPLVRSYGAGENAYVRAIRKPVSGSVLIAVNGAPAADDAWSVDPTTGVVMFASPPPPGALVTAGFAFDTPVRFDADLLEVRTEGFGAARFATVPLVEALV
ncbi:MAG: DUF2460 domain-containing protein [Hyphomonadaceae bacterium]|nr:DUF2460 domain-containing protein [Hyphomonadaceae bacterium]